MSGDDRRSGSARVTLALVLAASILLATMIVPDGGGIAVADLVLAFVAGHAALTLATRGGLVDGLGTEIRRIGLAMLAFVGVAAASATLFDGSWLQVGKDAFAFAYLITTVVLLGTDGAQRNLRAFYLAASVMSVTFAGSAMVAESATRATAFMANPNMAASWMSCMLLVLVQRRTGLAWWVRAAVAVILAAGILATGSYSAVVGISLAAIYLVVSGSHKRIAAFLLLLCGIALVAFWNNVEALIERPERLDRSSTTRSQLWDAALNTWKDSPEGIGPGNFSAQNVYLGFQSHNDYLGVLVENGIFGLAALLALLGTLWVCLDRFGRTLLIFVAIDASFHNILNYRHIWLLLGVAVVVAATDRRVSEDSDLGHKRKAAAGNK